MRRARGAGLWLVLVLGLTVAALGGCGDDDEPAAAPTTAAPAGGGIELSIRHDDGAGNRETAILTCNVREQRAGGFLTRRASVQELCAKARSIKALLTTPPDRARACTQIYGGPETAHITGTIDGAKVDRRFSRTNGCEIDDFNRAGELLQP
ncbi:MAG: hypothetical protein Q8K79_04320 [Solirubrobacteraceae bacterium]|nr:hypothetical protein [Solirubrobacteraceae bacterium]